MSREFFLRCAPLRLAGPQACGRANRSARFPRRLSGRTAFGSVTHFTYAFAAPGYTRTFRFFARSTRKLSPLFSSTYKLCPTRGCVYHLSFHILISRYACNPHRLISLQNTGGRGTPLFTARSVAEWVRQMVTSRIGGAPCRFLLDCVLVYETVDAGLYPALGNGTGSVS